MANLTSSLTVRLIDDVSKPARTVAQALEQAGKEAKKVAEAMKGSGGTDRLNASLAKLKLGAKDIEQVSRAWKDYSSSAKLAANASDWTKRQASDVRRWESQTISALKAVQREEAAFARAQKKAMSQPMPGTGGHGAHGGASQWGHGGALGFAAQGAAAAVSAHAVYHVSKSAVEQGSEYQHERVALMNAGRTKDLARMEEAAKQTALALPTTSYTEALKTINETTSAFGSIDHAIENLGFMMKTAAVLKSAGAKDANAGEIGQNFAKFFEMRGVAANREQFQREGNMMTQAMVATRNSFNPEKMLAFAQQAKGALRFYDEDFLTRVVPSLVTEQKNGDRAGTGANAFFNTAMGKARDKKQTKAWLDLGLLDPKMVSDKKDSWTAGAIKNTRLLMQNPLRWMEEVGLPAMTKKGINVQDKEALGIELSTLFRNSMAQMFANEIAQPSDRVRLHKDAGIYSESDHPDKMYTRNLGEDPSGAIDALNESLKNIGAAVTTPGMKAAAGVISGIAGSLQQLAAAAKDHPMLAMTAGGAAAAGGMAGAGYLTYQFATGFGLKTAAAELSGAAAALTGAAEKQALAGGAGGLGGGVGAGGKLLKTLPLIGTAVVGAEIAIDQLNAYKKRNPNEFHAHAGHAYGDDKAAAPAKGHWEQEPGRNKGYTRHWVDDTVAQAAEVQAAIQSINTNVAPTVDTSGMMAALGVASELLAKLSAIAGAASGAASAVRGINVPSLGGVQRGNFTAGGIQGE
jgi:hypothetical protein